MRRPLGASGVGLLVRLLRHPATIPAILATVLSASCIGLGYFWDDYLFLTYRGTGDPKVYLLPDPGSSFYRPISQSLYFLFLKWLDPRSGAWGHWINLAVLVATTGLFATLVAKLGGRRVGILAGIAFASAGSTPGLVAWISGSQDLFAIAFVVLALWLRHTGRSAWAAVAAACALLSKEAALAVFPVLVGWDVLVGRRPYRIARQVALYSAILVLWAAIHPGIHVLAGRGFRSGATGYVGLEEPVRWVKFFVRYVLTLLNVPIFGFRSPWLSGGAVYAVAGLAVAFAGLWWSRRDAAPDVDAAGLSRGRLLALALLLMLLPLLLPSTMIALWAPYYATLGAIGAALGLGVLLARAPWMVAGATLGAYLILGVCCRGMITTAEAVWSEAVFREASRAARDVESNFKKVLPRLDGRAHVYVSITSTGFRGIRSTLLEAQALRVWYDNPAIQALPPERWSPGATSEVLIRVTSNLDVVRIDPERFRVEWSGSGAPQPMEVSRSILAYARGLASAGRFEEAESILVRLGAVESGPNVPYVRRVVAMVLLAAGEEERAARVMASAASFPYAMKREILVKIFSEPTSSAALDSCAFPAFELSASDPDVVRDLMRRFREDGHWDQALDFARRLERLGAGDEESREVIRAVLDRRSPTPRRP